MNTKFDVGQRVTYPVVHTADGNVIGIAVTRAGVTRYAIGPNWYAEEDLKLAAEEKPVTEPAESEPAESEPAKLYCVKSFIDILSAGKIYEPDESGYITYDDGCKSNHSVSDWEFDFIRIGNLVPLVRRPAKVGEWIYPLEDCPFGRYKKGELLKCTIDDKNVTDVWRRKAVEYNNSRCVIKHDEYLVLGGYAGDPA